MWRSVGICVLILLAAQVGALKIKGHVYRLSSSPQYLAGAEVYVLEINSQHLLPEYATKPLSKPAKTDAQGIYEIELPDDTKTFTLLAHDPRDPQEEHSTFSPEFDVATLKQDDLLDQVDLQVVKQSLYKLLRGFAFKLHGQAKATKDQCEIIVTVGGLDKTLVDDMQGRPVKELADKPNQGGSAVGMTVKLMDMDTKKVWPYPWYFGEFPVIHKTNPLAHETAVSPDGGVTWPAIQRNEDKRYVIHVENNKELYTDVYQARGANVIRCPKKRPWNVPEKAWEKTFIIDVSPPAGLSVQEGAPDSGLDTITEDSPEQVLHKRKQKELAASWRKQQQRTRRSAAVRDRKLRRVASQPEAMDQLVDREGAKHDALQNKPPLSASQGSSVKRSN